MTRWITGSRRERRGLLFLSFDSAAVTRENQNEEWKWDARRSESQEYRERERERERRGERSTEVREETKIKVAGRVLAMASFHPEALFTSLPGKRTRRKTRRSEKHCVFECVAEKRGDPRDIRCHPFATPFIRADTRRRPYYIRRFARQPRFLSLLRFCSALLYLSTFFRPAVAQRERICIVCDGTRNAR